MQAVDNAIKYDNDPNKYYRYLDFSEMMKIQVISNYTMKNKLDLISKGFMVYKIKQHIESLREQLDQKENKIETREREIEFSSKLSFLPKSDPTHSTKKNYQNNNALENEDYDQEYLLQRVLQRVTH